MTPTIIAARRIVSLLPSATEMACALGLGDRLMGVTHECDHPPEIKGKPIVVRGVLPTESMSQREIDTAVAERLRNGLNLYQVDEALMRKIAPDLILTQDLCQVCAPSGNEVSELLKQLPGKPQILWMTPKSLSGIEDNLRELGEATGRLRQAEALIASGRAKLDRIAAVCAGCRIGLGFFAWNGSTLSIAADTGSLKWCGSPGASTNSDAKAPIPSAFHGNRSWHGRPKSCSSCLAAAIWRRARIAGEAYSLTPVGSIFRQSEKTALMPWMRTPISRGRGQGSSKERSFWLISCTLSSLIGRDPDKRFGGCSGAMTCRLSAPSRHGRNHCRGGPGRK
jgi:hypothetical protein